MTASKKPHPSPDFLPLPSELVDTDCRHSNALAKALVDTIRSHWPGARAHQDDDEEGGTAS